MRLIDAELFIEEMRELYARKGWEDNDVHFSLRDLESNINVQKTVFEDADMLQINQTLNEIRTALLRPFFSTIDVSDTSAGGARVDGNDECCEEQD